MIRALLLSTALLLPSMVLAQQITPGTTGAPSGSAGGDLGGTYPNPTALKTNGVSFGTSATVNTGTSGATVPLLNGGNTFSGYNVLTGGAAIQGLAADNASQLGLTGTQVATGNTARGLSINTVFAPNGSLNVNGETLNFHLGTANGNNIANLEGIFVNTVTIDAGYLGTTPAVTVFEGSSFVNSGNAGTPAPTFVVFYVDPLTNGNGITTGSAANYGLDVTTPTAAAGAGGTVTNTSILSRLGSGSSAGTTNYGLQITGNGGASSTNWAINSSSTASSQLSGPLTISSAALGTSGAISTAAVTSTGLALNTAAATITDTGDTGTEAQAAIVAFGAPTYTASSATTYSNANTLLVTAPTCSTNVTCTTTNAIFASGNIRTSGLLVSSAGLTTSGAAVSINASSNFATNIGTGSTTSTVTVGGGSNAVTLNSTTLTLTGSTVVTTASPFTASNATITMAGITTGTNADFVCRTAGGVLLIQTSSCTISSRRFKENIRPYKLDVLATLQKLPIITFDLKPANRDKADPNSKADQIGMLAEDVARLFPKCAIYDNDMKTPKSYRQECMIAVLAKAVQEQQVEIDELKTQLKAERVWARWGPIIPQGPRFTFAALRTKMDGK